MLLRSRIHFVVIATIAAVVRISVLSFSISNGIRTLGSEIAHALESRPGSQFRHRIFQSYDLGRWNHTRVLKVVA